MKVERLLLCVDGSPAALEAMRLAVDLAAGWNAAIRAVCVVQDSVVAAAIDAAGAGGQAPAPAEQRLASAAGNLLAHVANHARERGVTIETVLRLGDPFQEIVAVALAYQPDFILIGRVGRHGPGSMVIGTVTAHLLEFTEWPTIVVPARREAERHAWEEPGT